MDNSFNPIAGIVYFNAINKRRAIPYQETPDHLRELYQALLAEEFEEFQDAWITGDETGMVDALGDLIVVAVGNLYRMGYDPVMVLREINSSNLSKLGEDGQPVLSETGKILKGPNYQPPDLTKPELKLSNL